MTCISVLGGTFDPPHNGHLGMAKAALDPIGLCSERVLMIPAGTPPHKPAPQAPWEQRLDMYRKFCQIDKRIDLDERELHRPGPSYTYDTLRELRDELSADTPLVMLLGEDAALKLNTWHRWQDILSLAHIAVCPRPQKSRWQDILSLARIAVCPRSQKNRWQSILSLAHIAVCPRPQQNSSLEHDMHAMTGEATVLPAVLRESPAGQVAILPKPVDAFSSTAIRNGSLPLEEAVPLEVAKCIPMAGLYPEITTSDP